MLEVKKSQEEYNKWDKRQYLQNQVLEQYKLVGAYASFIYPENEKEILNELRSITQ